MFMFEGDLHTISGWGGRAQRVYGQKDGTPTAAATENARSRLGQKEKAARCERPFRRRRMALALNLQRALMYRGTIGSHQSRDVVGIRQFSHVNGDRPRPVQGVDRNNTAAQVHYRH